CRGAPDSSCENPAKNLPCGSATTIPRMTAPPSGSAYHPVSPMVSRVNVGLPLYQTGSFAAPSPLKPCASPVWLASVAKRTSLQVIGLTHFVSFASRRNISSRRAAPMDKDGYVVGIGPLLQCRAGSMPPQTDARE